MTTRNASIEFTENAADVLALLELIQHDVLQEVRGTERRFGKAGRKVDWGDVGDVARIRELLVEILVPARIGKDNEEDTAKRVIETEVAAHRTRRG